MGRVRSLSQFKEMIKSPIMLHDYGVTFSIDQEGRLSDQTRNIAMTPGQYTFNHYKLADRAVSFFFGRKDEPVTLRVVFMESKDAAVTKFFDTYYSKIYNSNGEVNLLALKGLLARVKVYQYDKDGKIRIIYTYNDCFFIEETDLGLSHSSNEAMTMTFSVYARNMERVTTLEKGHLRPPPRIPWKFTARTLI